jgi:hypothetical protein
MGHLSVLMAIFCALAVIGVDTEQRNETRIGRFGTVGQSLSEHEIAQIADLANAAGKPVWLMLGLSSMIPGVATLDAYLQPDVSTERLRRGRMLRLVANEDPPAVPERSAWTVKDTTSYAYVPLSEKAGEIASKEDLTWPFTVEGSLDDDTLVSLVKFVRSSPPIRGVPEGQGPSRLPRAPLSKVVRLGDQFIAVFRVRDGEGFGVWLIKKDGKWLVTKWSWSIA